MAERSRSSTAEATPEEADSPKGQKDAPFYCPGCGKRVQYQQQCTGRPESPHPPIEVVSTDELANADDPDKVTHAPSTENLG